METTYENVHPYFKLNGLSLSNEELREVGYSLIKEGETFEKAIGDFILDWLNVKETITVRTSGSTGTPKRIMLRKQHMVNSALATGSFFRLDHYTKALLCLPAEYIAGKMMLVRAMVLGWDLDYVLPSSDPLANTAKNYDFTAMVPLQLQNSLESLQRIKTIIVGGAPIPLAVQGKLAPMKVAVYETFGMTETLSHIALKKISEGHPETCFTALPGISNSKDDRGCLVIEAPGITESPVVTNDMVHLVASNKFEWLGRVDTVINSGGVKLHPETIEQKLEPLISARFFVAGIPDPQLGQKIVLFIEGNADDTLLDQLKAQGRLEKFEVPKDVYGISKFVLSANGKIQRAATLEKMGINTL